MSEPRRDRVGGWGLRLLLRLFPEDFRHQYEDEMRETYVRRLAEEAACERREARARLARLRLRARVHLDLVRAALLTRASSWMRPRPRAAREREGDSMLGSLGNDIRHALRSARKRPGFIAVAVATLAVGIGADTALFSLARATLLQPLPVPEPARVVRLFGASGSDRYDVFSYPSFEDIRSTSRSFEHLAVQRDVPVVLGGDQSGRAVSGELVSAEYFAALGVSAALGRSLQAQDFEPGAGGPVVVLSHRLWRGAFGGALDVLGTEIELNRRTFTVVGVMPPGFSGSYAAFRADLWAPIVFHEELRPLGIPLSKRGWGWLTGTGRLAPGVTIEQAQAELSTIAERLEREYPDSNRGISFRLEPASRVPEATRSAAKGLLGALALVVSLVLLAACANVGGVMLGRVMDRHRELSVRSSLGASRGRLMRLLLAEAIAIGIGGAVLGLLVAEATGRLLVRTLASADGMQSFAPALELDSATVLFALGLALATALLFGLLPAVHAARGGGLRGLRSDPSMPGGVRARSWSALIVAQVAIATVLLVGAGLLLRTVWRAEAFDPGFRSRGIVLASLGLSPHGYDEAEAGIFLREVRARLEALPGVTSASWANTVPLGGDRERLGFLIPGHRGSDERESIPVDCSMVGPGYFETIELPLLAGRTFGPGDYDVAFDGAFDGAFDDDRDAARAVVVNRTFADTYFAGREPIGSMLGVPGSEAGAQIVGVVADAKYYSLGEEPRPFLYLPGSGTSAVLFVASDGGPGPLLAAVRQAIADQDPQVVPRGVTTFVELRRVSLFVQRTLGALTGLLAALALCLSGLGLYGAVSYAVTRRRRELGLRMALGARPAALLRLVLGRAGLLIGFGLVLGFAGGLAGGRALSSLLFQVSPFDPATFGVTALVVAVAVALASYLPALDAVRADPQVALRQD
ncbi:MAG TPA: ADOP family duplicated permease [Thermoanaerobaculia bacterium]|nr:ADOP family duplicated permease [Thermoanaerobaculia bacterium]